FVKYINAVLTKAPPMTKDFKNFLLLYKLLNKKEKTNIKALSNTPLLVPILTQDNVSIIKVKIMIFLFSNEYRFQLKITFGIIIYFNKVLRLIIIIINVEPEFLSNFCIYCCPGFKKPLVIVSIKMFKLTEIPLL